MCYIMLFNNEGRTIIEESAIDSESLAYVTEQLVAEGLSNEELAEFLENSTEVNTALSESVLLERTIVRLDKKAKYSRAKKMAVFAIAKKKKDRYYKKLVMAWKMERKMEDLLMQKYGAPADKLAREAIRNAKNSKSSMIKKAADKAKSVFNSSSAKK